jgi:hypothetical protein
MTPCKVLLVDANRRASAPILKALREAGLALDVVSQLSQLPSICGCRAFDVIAIVGEHSDCTWADQLKLLSAHTAVVLLCSGPQPLNLFSPPVDAVCPTDSPRLAVHAILSAVISKRLSAFRYRHSYVCRDSFDWSL